MTYNISKDSTKKTLFVAAFIIAVFLCQWLLFSSYVQRELSWSPYMHDDETWRLPASYEVFEHMLQQKSLLAVFFHPTRDLFFVQAAIMYLFFGVSRLTALSLNFLYYILWQLAVFIAVYKLTKNRSASFIALALALLIPGPEFFGTLTFFNHSFVAQSLFWIFMSVVLGSNIFLDTKWSAAAGLISGILIFTRPYYAVFLVSAYLFPLLLCALLVAVYRGRPYGNIEKVNNLIRVRNIFISGLIPVATCTRFLLIISQSFLDHYVRPASGVSKEFDYLFWGQGAGTGAAKYLFYPMHAKAFFSGGFWIMSLLLIAAVGMIFFVSRFMNRKANAGFYRLAVIDFKLSAVFIGACLVIPYLILSNQVAKGGQLAGVFLSSVYWIIVLAIIGLYNRAVSFYKDAAPLSKLAFGMAVIVFIFGISFQLNLYSRPARPLSSMENWKEMTAINRMYGDICELCQKKGWQNPAISVDNWVWYLYGNALNLKTIYYERYRSILDIQPRLGQSMFTVDETIAMSLINASDIVIIGAPQGMFPVVELSAKLKIDDFIKKEFLLLGIYKIGKDAISVYYNKNVFKISASSSGAGHYGHRAFDGSVEPDDFWEAGNCPQWLQLVYSEGKELVKYELLSGYAEPDRMPKDWKLQGSDNGIVWNNLDERKDQVDWKTYDKRSYTVANPAVYRYYRFYFTCANSPLIRVYDIKLAYKDE